jgi:hypothetical protein
MVTFLYEAERFLIFTHFLTINDTESHILGVLNYELQAHFLIIYVTETILGKYLILREVWL